MNTQAEVRHLRDEVSALRRRVAELEGAATQHHGAEQALHAARQRLYDVLESLPAYVALLTPDYHISFANRTFREYFGESTKRCYEHLFGRHEPCESCETYKTLATHAPQHWEWTGPNGRIYDVHDYPFTDTDGSPLILELGVDITERKNAEIALREVNETLERRVSERTAELSREKAISERMLETLRQANDALDERVRDRTAELRVASLYTRSLIEASPDPLVTISQEGVITDVNRATEEATGVPRERLIGTDFADYFTEPQDAHKGYRTVIAKGSVHDYPLTIRHVSGSTMDVLYNATVYRNETGELQGVFAAARDVTRRKLAEEALRKASLYARSLIEASLDPLVTISPQGVITDVNEATEQATGVPREKLIGTDFADYFTEPTRARKGYQHVIAEGLVRDYSLTIRHVSGSTMDVFYNASVYRNEDGELQGVFAAARDVTERNRAEAALQQANAQVAQRAEQLRVLASELTQAEQRERRRLAQVLHDHLQQLMVAAKLHLDVAQRRANANTQELLQQVHQLLDESIQVSRSLTVELSPPLLYDVGLTPALQWLAQWMHEKHGLAVNLVAEDEVQIDSEDVRVLLFQAVRELLFNIVKHAQADSAVVELTRPQKQQVQVVVADSGVGFDPSQRQVGRIEGGGFGLFSIQERLQSLGGHIEIESAPGRGTRIVLCAPVSEGASYPHREPVLVGAGAPAALADQTAPCGAKIGVLLVDDRQIVREGLASLLRAQPDIEVLGEAGDGQAAIELTRRLRPDVVIMDVTMPRLNGIAATRRIVAEFPQISVIGLSMHEEEDMARAMRQAGAVAYLSKDGPFDKLVSIIYDSARSKKCSS